MEDRIEQRTTVRAAHDKVWQIITRPGWWLPGSSAEPARGPGQVSVVCGGDSRPYVIDIVRVEPQGYASFRWASAFAGAQPEPGRATLVEFYLRPVGDEVGVTVVESGFASLDLPEALREDEWKGSLGGWQYELAGLRTRAEGLTAEPAALPRTRPDADKADKAVTGAGDFRPCSPAVRRSGGRRGPSRPGRPRVPAPEEPALTRQKILIWDGMSVVYDRHGRGTLDSWHR